MTEAQVLALIQAVILANGNNDITANVLRPVLEALLEQPNILIGDLGDLQTTADSNLVEAINEVFNLTGSGVTILTGATDPNLIPPPVVNIGDFYIWDDGALQGFYQYNGDDFVLIKNLDIENDLVSTDVGQQLSIGTDGKLFMNGNPIPIENVYDDINSPSVGMLDNQIEQTTGFIQKVLDASADPNVIIEPGGSTVRYYEKLSTNTATLADYELLNTDYYIIYEIQGTTIINQIYNDSSAGTASTYGLITGVIDGVNTTFTVSEGVYKTGSLRVTRNGKGQVLGSAEDFIELDPSNGTFEFNTAPLVDDVVDVSYVKEDSGSSSVSENKNTVTVSADYTALVTDRNINVDASSGLVTITLPALTDIDTIGLSIKKTDITANRVIIVTPNTETIDGETTNTINTPFQSRAIITDGSNYFIGKTYTPKYQKEISITQPEQLDGVLRSDVVYLIDGKIDLGSIEIIVPEGGLFFTGHDYFVSGLFSTVAGHTMFKNGVGDYAGNFKMSNMFMTSSGVGSKIFELDNEENSGAIEFNSVNLGDFSDTTTSLGTLSNYRQFRTNDCGFFRNQDGLIFSGTWSGGFRINDTIVLSQLAGSTLFKPAIGLTFAGRCVSDINGASADPTTITFDFIPSNFLLNAGFQLIGASFAPNSSISVTTDETSIKALFTDCVEIRNTRPGFETTWTTEILTPLILNTPVKALGITTTSNNTWFSQTGNNEVTYNSTLTKDLKINIPLTIDGDANKEIKLILKRWDYSLSAYEDVKSKIRAINNLQGGNDVVTFNMTAIVNDVSENDRIEVWLENLTDSTSVTVLLGSELIAEVL